MTAEQIIAEMINSRDGSRPEPSKWMYEEAADISAALRSQGIDLNHRYQEAGGHFAGTGLYLRRPLEETR